MHVSHLINLNALNYHCNLILIIRFCTWFSRVWISSILCLHVETVWCNMLCIWGCTRLKFRRCHLILFHLNKSILKYYTYMCDNQTGLIRYVWLEIWGQLRDQIPVWSVDHYSSYSFMLTNGLYINVLNWSAHSTIISNI